MELWLCCRTCCGVLELNPIFRLEEHHEKYSLVLLETTGVKIDFNDSLPQVICTTCLNFINESYKFRKQCQQAQSSLTKHSNDDNKYQLDCELEDKLHAIDIADLVQDIDNTNIEENLNSHDYDNTLNDTNDELEKSDHEIKDSKPKVKRKPIKSKEKRARTRKPDKNNEGQQEKEEIECEYCHKILTSKLSLRNHYKIHTGFDVVCEHCGKKFITRRLLLMHCKAKHGYEKTDKCSYCDYRASNAEQVKIHERLHTGEKPYSCGSCDAAFHRKSSYLQHVAIHLPDKTVQCPECPGRFKSVTLMRIHMSRHRATRYSYRCALCDRDFARRRNVARHLCRIHAVSPRPDHIQRKAV